MVTIRRKKFLTKNVHLVTAIVTMNEMVTTVSLRNWVRENRLMANNWEPVLIYSKIFFVAINVHSGGLGWKMYNKVERYGAKATVLFPWLSLGNHLAII